MTARRSSARDLSHAAEGRILKDNRAPRVKDTRPASGRAARSVAFHGASAQPAASRDTGESPRPRTRRCAQVQALTRRGRGAAAAGRSRAAAPLPAGGGGCPRPRRGRARAPRLPLPPRPPAPAAPPSSGARAPSRARARAAPGPRPEAGVGCARAAPPARGLACLRPAARSGTEPPGMGTPRGWASPLGSAPAMSCTIEKILTDARTLLERLKEHDTAAESLIDQSAVLHQRVAAMREAGAAGAEKVRAGGGRAEGGRRGGRTDCRVSAGPGRGRGAGRPVPAAAARAPVPGEHADPRPTAGEPGWARPGGAGRWRGAAGKGRGACCGEPGLVLGDPGGCVGGRAGGTRGVLGRCAGGGSELGGLGGRWLDEGTGGCHCFVFCQIRWVAVSGWVVQQKSTSDWCWVPLGSCCHCCEKLNIVCGNDVLYFAELWISLEEHQDALELIMSKYRKQMLQLLQGRKGEDAVPVLKVHQADSLVRGYGDRRGLKTLVPCLARFNIIVVTIHGTSRLQNTFSETLVSLCWYFLLYSFYSTLFMTVITADAERHNLFTAQVKACSFMH